MLGLDLTRILSLKLECTGFRVSVGFQIFLLKINNLEFLL